MWWKLIFNSFRRDFRKKAVAIAAVTLATCLATFLLNWSLNLGDKLQKDLRVFGANIIVAPQGDSISITGNSDETVRVRGGYYLKGEEIKNLRKIFWKNQIIAVAPLLPVEVSMDGQSVVLVGSEYGNREAIQSLQKTIPYLLLAGTWPLQEEDLVLGESLSRKYHWKIGRELKATLNNEMKFFRVVGIVSSGGLEDQEAFATLPTVQALATRPKEFKQLLVSAVVNPPNRLYFKFQNNPKSLTSEEYERYSCTPYITSVAQDVAKVFTGGEASIVRQISETEQKVVKKVNWLMILVTFAALLASSLTMTSTTAALVLERRKELALMKAIGSNNSFVLRYLFFEILLLGAAGSLLGYALGSFLSSLLGGSIFETVFVMKPIVLPLVLFLGLLIILLGSVWPLRRAMLLDPAQALRDL
jgi:putative ABC transport system permease protein